MKIWILLVWLSHPFPSASSYETKAECEQYAAVYKRAACVEVIAPKPKP